MSAVSNFKPLHFYKRVRARSIKSAILNMDKWGGGIYHMFIVKVERSILLDEYVEVLIQGFEYSQERELHSC